MPPVSNPTTTNHFSTRSMIYVGVLAAIIIICTFIKVPLPTGSMVHLGSAALFTTSILFGGVYGGLGAAIGSAIFDIVAGKMAYTLFSIVIKGGAGLIVGYFTVGLALPHRNAPCPGYARIIGAVLLGAIWTAIGYGIAWWYLYGSLTVALTRMPASFLSSGIGLLITCLLAPRLYSLLARTRA